MVEENLLGELGAIRAEYDRECARLEEILRTRAGFREITKQHLIQGDAEKIKQVLSLSERAESAHQGTGIADKGSVDS